jgi:hypothetical protein
MQTPGVDISIPGFELDRIAAEVQAHGADGWAEGAVYVLRELGVTVPTSSTYPRADGRGRLVWACCESSIGRPCGHQTA